MSLSERLIALRQAKGLTTNKLAKMAGIAQSTLRDIEIGQKQPTIPTLSQICDALGVTLSEFFSDTEQELTLELRRLVENAKQLDPDQIEALNQFIKTMTQSTASVVDEDGVDYGDTLAAHRTDNPTDDMEPEAWDSIQTFKKFVRKDQDSKRKSGK
jgi:transcriptional regulator with XRE-family HTH domain